MNKFLRKILAPLPGLVRWYLSKKRSYRHEDLTIEVLPGVFHPGLFFSTKMLLRYIAGQSLKGTSVLELGAGTGMISLQAASMGAGATATDISPLAVRNIYLNAIANKATVTIIQSDLFDNIPPQKFNWIFINPPYYAKKPRRPEDYAWFCGEQHEYFTALFAQLPPYITSETQVIMVLSQVCDLQTIFRIASQHKFEFVMRQEKRVWIDGKNYIFQIRRTT